MDRCAKAIVADPTRRAALSECCLLGTFRAAFGPVAQGLEPTAHNGLVPGLNPGKSAIISKEANRVISPCSST